jgi:hypothetical protein
VHEFVENGKLMRQEWNRLILHLKCIDIVLFVDNAYGDQEKYATRCNNIEDQNRPFDSSVK